VDFLFLLFSLFKDHIYSCPHDIYISMARKCPTLLIRASGEKISFKIEGDHQWAAIVSAVGWVTPLLCTSLFNSWMVPKKGGRGEDSHPITAAVAAFTNS